MSVGCILTLLAKAHQERNEVLGWAAQNLMNIPHTCAFSTCLPAIEPCRPEPCRPGPSVTPHVTTMFCLLRENTRAQGKFEYPSTSAKSAENTIKIIHPSFMTFCEFVQQAKMITCRRISTEMFLSPLLIESIRSRRVAYLLAIRLVQWLGWVFKNKERKTGSSLEMRLPSGAPKEEFGRMIFEKNLPWGTVLKFSHSRRQVLVEVRRGAATCDAPCIFDYHCSSASP